MQFDKPWTRWIGNVHATVELLCAELTADQVTQALGIQPTSAAPFEVPAKFEPGGISPAANGVLWQYDTNPHISSFNLSDHLRHLLRVFLPLKSRIEEMRPTPFICVRVHWAGPKFSFIAADCVAGLGELRAALKVEMSELEGTEDV